LHGLFSSAAMRSQPIAFHRATMGSPVALSTVRIAGFVLVALIAEQTARDPRIRPS
jgi:hypothetical protein